ncbi:hypothetical protein [Sulfobacillus thermosulfidooxidans]|uniref:hypothetical protein n=1 Tax=Sulfobacillus thermosulfidooxidans TaxID=28034 RepID=UPI0006B4F140|nr:hypothetical protein [Sulfobacillus thermosulfidooxidans]
MKSIVFNGLKDLIAFGVSLGVLAGILWSGDRLFVWQDTVNRVHTLLLAGYCALMVGGLLILGLSYLFSESQQYWAGSSGALGAIFAVQLITNPRLFGNQDVRGMMIHHPLIYTILQTGAEIGSIITVLLVLPLVIFAAMRLWSDGRELVYYVLYARSHPPHL